MNGNREQTNNFMLDGVDMNETIDNRVAYQPSPDALAEISVETNNYAADIGNVAGAVISSVIKSGANQFRGNVFEFYRNSDFDANTWENNRSGATKAERTQHIFGATLGGPIIKNKLFFFADYQGSSRDQPGSATASVAPAAWRAGDLSSLSRAPSSGTRSPASRSRTTRSPLSRISPTALAILNDTANYPLPNRDVSGVTGNYVGDTLTTYRAHQGDLRLDWNASANDKLFGRFSIAEFTDETTKTPFPLSPRRANDPPFRNVAVNWSHVFGPSLINEVLVGYNSTDIVELLNDWAGIGDANAKYGIPGGQPIAGLSSIAGAAASPTLGAAAPTPTSSPKTYQINEKLTWLKGRHALKFGGQFLHYDQQRFYAGNNGAARPLQLQRHVHAASAFADFLLDQVSTRAVAAATPTTPGPTSRTGSPSSSRTTSRSGPT